MQKMPQIKPTTLQIFQRCYGPKINFSVALLGQIYRLLSYKFLPRNLLFILQIGTYFEKDAK